MPAGFAVCLYLRAYFANVSSSHSWNLCKGIYFFPPEYLVPFFWQLVAQIRNHEFIHFQNCSTVDVPVPFGGVLGHTSPCQS